MTILAVLGRTFQVDRVYVFEDSDDHLRCSNTFEWCAPLITPEKDNLQDLSYETDLNSEYHENFSNLGVFLCPDIEKLPKAQRDILLPQGIKSMLQCSIIDNGLFSGYIGFDICKKKREWSQNQVDTLMQTTKILGTFIIKKRHEEKLIQANRKMTDILDRIPAGIGIFEQKSSGSFQIYYQNDSYYTLMGTSRNRITDNNEFIQRAIEKIHPEDRQLLKDQTYQAIKESKPIDFIYRCIVAKKDYIWIRLVGSVHQNPMTGRKMMYCIFTDFSEQMKQRQILEKDKALLNLAMNIAKMNSWEFDSDTKTIHQDSAARHQHFITSTLIHDAPESIIKENIIAPSSVSAFRNLFRLAENERETSHSAEIQLFGHNRKEYKWERIILTPLSKSQGQSNRFLGTSIDITEQKRLQENYVNELNLMENLSSPNLVAKGRYGLKSNKLEYFQTNKNSIDFQNITTYDEGMMATASLCIDPIQKNEFISIFSRKNLLAKFKKGINDFSYTYRRKALDGSSFWCRTQGKLFVDPSSNEEKCFIFSYDINTSKIQQEMISTVIQLNYDYLIIINIHENTYRMFTTGNGYQSSIHQNEVMEYEKSMETYAKKSVVPDEIEKNIHDMSIANIIEQLDSKDSFSSFVNIVCSNGKTARKLLQFSYIDKSDGLVLLSRIDVSESYRQERSTCFCRFQARFLQCSPYGYSNAFDGRV